MEISKEEMGRFNSFCHEKNECRLWKGKKDKDGYGIFYFRKKSRKAHRVSFYIHYGSIREGMVIDHICKNRNCVAINHLRMITVRENILDNSLSVGAINKRRTTCKRGHPFDRKYGTKKIQRYCSVCENDKSKRLRKKWLKEANEIKC